jgi:hypothetical protein
MQRCSFFIKNKALFGSFPTQEMVEELESNGVRYFVDLTNINEIKTTSYTTQYKYIKYSIADHKAPRDWKSFAKLIINLCRQIRSLCKDEKIYIHCRGGHGRSGIVVASILCYYYKISADQALNLTKQCHSHRPQMREKWRSIGSPQSKKQKDFVRKFFRPLKYGKNGFGYTIGLDNSTEHIVNLEGIGIFPNAHLAFQAFRDPENKNFIQNLVHGSFGTFSLPQNNHWEMHKLQYMLKVLESKFLLHADLRTNLINTGLRPLIKISSDDYWGQGNNGQGKNMHGKLLTELREQFLQNEVD